MNETEIKAILDAVSRGALDVKKATEQFKDFPIADIDFAKLDTHRAMRRGFPETILAEGKTTEHLIAIARKATENKRKTIITRTSGEQRKALSEQFSSENLRFYPPSSLVTIEFNPPKMVGRGKIGVVSAGTSDIPVAREAIATAQFLGNEVEEIFDVGVAGLHRILEQLDKLRNCSVVVVVAGMDGALPSVVAGLLDVPVIAVPTSVGYGASFEGLAALLTMLNSCASGVVVVNIDNGFGAGVSASLMNRPSELSP